MECKDCSGKTPDEGGICEFCERQIEAGEYCNECSKGLRRCRNCGVFLGDAEQSGIHFVKMETAAPTSESKKIAHQAKVSEKSIALGKFLLSLSQKEIPKGKGCFANAVAYYKQSTQRWMALQPERDEQKTVLALAEEYPYWEAAQRPRMLGHTSLTEQQQKEVGDSIAGQLEQWSKLPWGQYLS